MASHKFKVPRLERRLGRYELMSWMNSFLRIDYTKVEEFSDGIAYCQVVDALLPGSVPLHKLAFHPRNREDKIRYKVQSLSVTHGTASWHARDGSRTTSA